MSNSFITDSTPAGDYEKITVSGTALPFTAAKIAINQEGGMVKRAVKAFVTVETNSIRIKLHGGTPTTTDGHLIASGDGIMIEGDENVSKFRMIAAASDGTAHVTYFYNR